MQTKRNVPEPVWNGSISALSCLQTQRRIKKHREYLTAFKPICQLPRLEAQRISTATLTKWAIFGPHSLGYELWHPLLLLNWWRGAFYSSVRTKSIIPEQNCCSQNLLCYSTFLKVSGNRSKMKFCGGYTDSPRMNWRWSFDQQKYFTIVQNKSSSRTLNYHCHACLLPAITNIRKLEKGETLHTA